jgi:predicted nucleotidyltransferase
MPNIDLPDKWRAQIIRWATATNAVDELWLFGSRAKGTSRRDSDVDIAVSLMPAQGGHDWALGDYLALSPMWQRTLEAIVGRHVSLTAIVPDTPGDAEVRGTGVLLWRRSASGTTPLNS